MLIYTCISANTIDMTIVKKLYKENRFNEALQAILKQARYTDDYNTYASLCRWRNKLKGKIPENTYATNLRIAILGSATTEFIEDPLKLELETVNIGCDLFVSNYNTYVSEMLDENSDAALFEPNIAIFILTPFAIPDWPDAGCTVADVGRLVDKICNHWTGLCESFHSHTNCEIIINNMHMLPTRPNGNLGTRLAWDQNNFLRRINCQLGLKMPDYVHILDVETLSSLYGLKKWFDFRFWHHSKQPVNFECIVPFVRNLSAIIGGLYGHTCKCIVVDLDNTLWGGVVGDDGIEGIKIGQGDAESESFRSFQQYLLNLKNRGIILAVCSKNEEANALAPFEQLSDMVLKRDDFVSFKANWEPKSENLKAIALELNIGIDSIIFVDDNPAERELVKQLLPQVKVLELSDDPADYPMILDQCGWLEPVKLTDEDRNKTEKYKKNIQREEQISAHASYESYLISLDQKAVVKQFERKHLDRITQLINKTNQFNLTTVRLNRSEVEGLMDNKNTLTACIRLVDKFGDNGLISVLIGHKNENILHIDLWLMSCRVFKRGVEFLLSNYLFEQARYLGVDEVHSTYVPSEKNHLVSDHYEKLGFKKLPDKQGNQTKWAIKVKDYRPVTVYISLKEGI